MSILRAERVDFQIAPGYWLEIYRLPSGEYRIGMTSVAVICGLRKSYFADAYKRGSKHLEGLKAKGFTGQIKEVYVGRTDAVRGGISKSATLSINDCRAVIRFAAMDLGKKPAMAIADSLIGVALESLVRKAYGEDDLTLEQIRYYICKQFATTLNWMEEDRDDSRIIDEHLLFLRVAN